MANGRSAGSRMKTAFFLFDLAEKVSEESKARLYELSYRVSSVTSTVTYHTQTAGPVIYVYILIESGSTQCLSVYIQYLSTETPAVLFYLEILFCTYCGYCN